MSAAPPVAPPLAGITVVEMAQNLAGPYAGSILAQLGADVVKVERPEGDDARGWGPPFWQGTSPGFLAVNLDKRSVAVDMKDPEARAWLADFAARADVFVQNLRPGLLEEVGLGPDALRSRNPRLIYCSLWAFGRTGPLRLRPGYEPMVQAFAGLMMLSGGDDDPPLRMGTPLCDLGAGMWTVIGVLAGLAQRERTGRGCVVDTSLFETALGWLTNHAASHRVTGDPPARHRTGSTRLVVFQGFETKTGPLIVAAGNDRLFAKLAQALDRPEWAADPRFATNAQRSAHKDVLIPEIERIMRTRPKGEWLDRLEAAGVPCAPIHTMPEALGHPQALATGMLQPVPDLGLELMGLPLSFDGLRPPIRRRPPELGEHTDEVRDGPAAPRRAPPRPAAAPPEGER